MQSIATLVQNDPYLKMPMRDRITAQRERRARIWPIAPIIIPTPPLLFFRPRPNPYLESLVYRFWCDDLVAFAERVLARPPPKRATIKQIQRVVAKHYGMNWQIMFSASRKKKVIIPRHVAMYLAKKITELSFPQIGLRFGGRDHTTVMNAIWKTEMRMASDKTFAANIEQIKIELAVWLA